MRSVDVFVVSTAKRRFAVAVYSESHFVLEGMRTNILKLQSSYDYFKPMDVRRAYYDGTVSNEYT